MPMRCSATRASERNGKPLAVAMKGTTILAGSEAVRVTTLTITRMMGSALDMTLTATRANGTVMEITTATRMNQKIKDNNHNRNSINNISRNINNISKNMKNIRGRRRSSSGTSSGSLNRRVLKDLPGKKCSLTVKTHCPGSFKSQKRSGNDKRPQATSEMISTETNGLGTTLNSVKRTKRKLSNIIGKTIQLHLTRKASNSLAGSSSVFSLSRCSDSSKAIQVSGEMAAASKTTTSEDTIVIE